MASTVQRARKTGLSLHSLGVICGLTAGVWLGAAEAPTKLVTAGFSPFLISLGIFPRARQLLDRCYLLGYRPDWPIWNHFDRASQIARGAWVLYFGKGMPTGSKRQLS